MVWFVVLDGVSFICNLGAMNIFLGFDLVDLLARTGAHSRS